MGNQDVRLLWLIWNYEAILKWPGPEIRKATFTKIRFGTSQAFQFMWALGDFISWSEGIIDTGITEVMAMDIGGIPAENIMGTDRTIKTRTIFYSRHDWRHHHPSGILLRQQTPPKPWSRTSPSSELRVVFESDGHAPFLVAQAPFPIIPCGFARTEFCLPRIIKNANWTLIISPNVLMINWAHATSSFKIQWWFQ